MNSTRLAYLGGSVSLSVAVWLKMGVAQGFATLGVLLLVLAVCEAIVETS